MMNGSYDLGRRLEVILSEYNLGPMFDRRSSRDGAITTSMISTFTTCIEIFTMATVYTAE